MSRKEWSRWLGDKVREAAGVDGIGLTLSWWGLWTLVWMRWEDIEEEFKRRCSGSLWLVG